MGTRIVISLLLLIVCGSLQAQDKKLLKQYVHRQFNLLPQLELSSGSHQSLKADHKPDEYSYAKIDELKDSLETSLDASYLFRIIIIYEGLNDIDSGRQYLRDLAVKFQEILENDPDSIELLRNLCQINFLLGDIYPAVEFADRILDVNPLDTDALITNAMIHFGIGDFSIAKEYAEKGIEAFPESTIYYYLKTMILTTEHFTLMNKDSWKGFNSDFSYIQKAEDAYKNNTEMQFGLLFCKLYILFYNLMMPNILNPPESFHKFQLTISDSLKLNDYEARYLKMSEMDMFRNYYRLYFFIGFINLLQGEYNDAIGYFTRSIEVFGKERLDKDNILGSYNNIMTCYLFMGDTIQAQNWTERKINDKVSIKSLPQDYIELARYHLSEGQLDQGEKLLQKAIELDSTTFEAYVELANIEMINENVKTAEELLDKCFKINPDCVEMYESAVLLSLFQGDVGTAKYYVNRLLVYDPKSSFALDMERDFLSK